ncbi:PREDICTED: uncharacterized protein LOC108569137 [Nicrophorus vespilloides]|uniref:Uncharacterized protein LOC108569137 n=1 Tax=Nicrophorus vespilloides TaxID=110193 RepID=A0ABM1NGV4_NICVS|nr:PREDICTED: uncharacterized protein LOC108569137 [Nicrophorus vespilloides]XP_017786055.1 PREDICTED: uncharacterized protein LOC108569137 [Nicrophorus vespilloides]
MPDVPLKTISAQVDRTQRQSLPSLLPIKPILRQTQSQNWGKKRPHVPPTILEVETEVNQSRASSVRSHHSKKSQRKSSEAVNGYENQSYDGPLPPNRTTNYSNSLRSSHNSSLQSLQVQKEQYCCCSRWSPCERKLVVSVAVLATIIVILLSIVSVLAKTSDEEERKVDVPHRPLLLNI